ncbi:esterase/lipase family protein [Rhodococcus sp. NPDC003322]
MTYRLRVAATTVAAIATFVVGTTIVPSATAAAPGRALGPKQAQGNLPGANEDCTPSPRHPRPVVLVHGTGVPMQETWGNLENPNLPGPLVQSLRADGYCVFALNYGYAPSMWIAGIPGPSGWGFGSMVESAKELARFIDAVREETGSAQVDVVGHSQGGTMARRYLLAEGGADPANPANNVVHTLVTLGPSNHGTTSWGNIPAAGTLLGHAIAIQEQTPGSRFLAELNAGPETLPGIEYTVIASTKDDRILPFESSFLNPAPGTERSVQQTTVQDACGNPNLAISHSRVLPGVPSSTGLLDDGAALFLVRRALDPTLPGTPPC